MLDHFERQHRIEAHARLDERFGVGVAIIDGQTDRFGMGLRRGDRRRTCVDARHGEAEPRHRLGGQTAAAPDVEQPEPGEGSQR